MANIIATSPAVLLIQGGSVEPPESGRVLLLRHGGRKEGGLAPSHDAGSNEQAPVSFHRHFLSNVRDVSERLRIIAPFEAGAMDRDVIVIACHSIFRLEIQLMGGDGSVVSID